jgi:hypothetical protein
MSKLKLNPDLVFREDNDGGLIFDPTTGNVQVLNETAAFICRILDGTHTPEEITDAVLAEFDTEDADAVKAEVVQFLDGLLRLTMATDA